MIHFRGKGIVFRIKRLDIHRDIQQRLSPKWILAGQQFVNDQSQRVLVSASTLRRPCPLFRRHVARSPGR